MIGIGSTTAERRVGSLDGVKRGYENPTVENAVRRAFKSSGFPTRSRPPELPEGLGELFRACHAEELGQRAPAAEVFTNTLVSRNEDALRIASCLPNTRFAFVKRNIEDLTIRIYMRNHHSGNEHAWTIADIRHYLEWCHDSMDIIAARMPENAIVLHHEEMVAHPARAIARVWQLCGLDASESTLPPVGDDRGCGAPFCPLNRL